MVIIINISISCTTNILHGINILYFLKLFHLVLLQRKQTINYIFRLLVICVFWLRSCETLNEHVDMVSVGVRFECAWGRAGNTGDTHILCLLFRPIALGVVVIVIEIHWAKTKLLF